MIYEVCGIRRFTGYAVCSIPPDSSRSLLHIDSNTTLFLGNEYKQYTQRLLVSQDHLKDLDLAPVQDRFLFDMATKAIASVIGPGNDLRFSTGFLRIKKLISFCGKT